MRTITFLIIVTLFPVTLFAQIPNNGFENWTNMGTYGNPDQWGNLNDYTASTGTFTCTKGAPGNPGSAYVKLISKTITGMGILPGIAVSGVLDITTMKAVSGFPCSIRPESLDGSWQFMANGDDQGYISVLLTSWNTSNHRRDTIAIAFLPLPGMVMSWRNFSIALNYLSGADPDSAIITASASNAPGVTIASGSYLYLDDLAFIGTVAGIKNQKNDVALHVYPNPVGQNLYVKLSGEVSGPVSLEIFNLEGKKLLSLEYKSPDQLLPVNVSQIPEGTYLLKITSAKVIYTQKFLRKY